MFYKSAPFYQITMEEAISMPQPRFSAASHSSQQIRQKKNIYYFLQYIFKKESKFKTYELIRKRFHARLVCDFTRLYIQYYSLAPLVNVPESALLCGKCGGGCEGSASSCERDNRPERRRRGECGAEETGGGGYGGTQRP